MKTICRNRTVSLLFLPGMAQEKEIIIIDHQIM